MSLISGVLDKVFDAVGLDETPVGEFLKGGIEVAAAAFTGDILTGIEGVKDIANAASSSGPAKVEYHAATPGSVPEQVSRQGYAASFDQLFANALDVLSGNFDLLDTAAGVGGKDGLIGKCDLSAALGNPAIPALVKDACSFLLANPAAWNRIDVGAGVGIVDGLIGRCDVDALASRLRAGSATTPNAERGSGTAAAGPTWTNPGAPQPGKTNETGGASSGTGTQASGTTGPANKWDARYENAVRVLNERFDLLDTAAGIGTRDGIIARCDLEAALTNPDVPAELKDACRFLLANPAAWNQLDVAAGNGVVDGFIHRSDVAAAASRLPAHSEAAAPTTSSGGTVDGGGGPRVGANPFEGMSPEQIVESMMLGMLNDFDDQMVDTADALRQAQDAKINAEPGSKDEKKANEDVNRLTLKLQDLVEKRRAMFEMLSNFSRVNHEMAKTAIGNMGRV